MTTGKTFSLSITHVGITNEEMGEAGLAARSASEIERSSILALGNQTLVGTQ
jgi:D-aminopeptidase